MGALRRWLGGSLHHASSIAKRLTCLTDVVESSIAAQRFSSRLTKEREMRKFLLVVCSLLVSPPVAMALSKIDTKWHCSKPSGDQKIHLGDVPGHSYWIGQGTGDAPPSDGA